MVVMHNQDFQYPLKVRDLIVALRKLEANEARVRVMGNGGDITQIYFIDGDPSMVYLGLGKVKEEDKK